MLGVVVAVGAAVRFYNLGAKSLWLDEVISTQATRFNAFADLIAWVKADIDQVPAFSTITWLLRGLGDGEVAMRLPSAIAGTLTIVAIYWFGRQLHGVQTALLAALLLAVLPFAVWYSQEARTYALFMLVTTLQMLFVHRVRRDGRLVNWSGLTVISILNLYTHYMAIAVTGAAYSYLGLCTIADALGGKLSMRQVFRAIGSAALIVLAFAPWLRALVTFLRSSDHGFARYGEGEVTITQLGSMFAGLGFSGLLLAVLGAGLLAVTVRAARSRDGSGLLLAWFVLPLFALAVRMRGAVLYLTPRYLSFLVPAMVIISAVGVTDVALLVAAAARRVERLRVRNLTAALAAIITGALLVQTIPALANSLELSKDDYRGMAAYVTRTSPPDSTVLALGQEAGFVVIGLGHYLEQSHSAAVVTNGAWLDDQVANRLATGHGAVWGALLFPSSAETVSATEHGLAVNSSFPNLLLVRPDPDFTPVDQARQLLRWDSPFVPRLTSSLDVIDMQSGAARLGANLLGATTPWAVRRTISDGNGGLHMQPSVGADAIARATLGQLTPGERYLVSFRYRNGGLRGSQTVVIVPSDAGGQQLTLFPSRFGYLCPPAISWADGFFGVIIPEGEQSMTIWLRASGSGEADFQAVQIRKVV